MERDYNAEREHATKLGEIISKLENEDSPNFLQFTLLVLGEHCNYVGDRDSAIAIEDIRIKMEEKYKLGKINTN